MERGGRGAGIPWELQAPGAAASAAGDYLLGPVTINVMEIASEERQKLYDAIAMRISGQ
jgi:hypothetical protein